MTTGKSQTVVNIRFDLCIESLKDACLSRDYELLEKILQPYFDFDSDNSHYSIREQAFINYYLGYYYIHFGKAKNLAGYQERGRDYLTNSIDLFSREDLSKELIEAQITLGWSYFQTGENDNYEIFLRESLERCVKDSEEYCSVSVSLLIVYYKIKATKKALELIDEIKGSILKCPNERIKWQYFLNSGLIYRLSNKPDETIESYKTAIQIAKNIRNKQFEGQTWNCLAYFFYTIEDYKTALTYSDFALNISKSINNKGLTAEILDTKALALLKNGDLKQAEIVINSALIYFREGESYADFAEALWNKILILDKLDKEEAIFQIFQELSNLCYSNLDRKIQSNYYQRFSNLILQKKSVFDFSKHFSKKTIKKIEFNDAVLPPQLQNKKIEFYFLPKLIAAYLDYSVDLIAVVEITDIHFLGDYVLIEQYQDLIITEIIKENNDFLYIDLNGNTIDRSTAFWVGRIVGLKKNRNSSFVSIV